MGTNFSVRHTKRIRAGIVAAIIATSLVFTACGPSDTGAAKLKALPKAAPRTSVLAAMGTGSYAATRPTDEPRIANGFRLQKFMSGGKMWEVLWYREAPGSLDDPITKATDTPVVLESDTLVGWGWKFYGPFAGKYNIPDPSTNATRRDSISKSQCPAGKVCTN